MKFVHFFAFLFNSVLFCLSPMWLVYLPTKEEEKEGLISIVTHSSRPQIYKIA